MIKRLTPGIAMLAFALMLLVLSNVMAGPRLATATHTPADKAVASGDTLVSAPLATTAGLGTDANNILVTRLRTSAPSDLILEVTLECSLITKVSVPGSASPRASSTGSSEGQIRVWIVVDDTYIVPVQNIGPTTHSHGTGTDSDKVTFCNREHRVTVTDAEDPRDGVDTQEHYLRTKDANAFNWLALNLGRGIHTIKVRADFTAPAETNSAGSTSEGIIGNRTLIVIPTKMANDITM